MERSLRGLVEGGGKRIIITVGGESFGIFSEGETADVVEGEAEEEILEIDSGAAGFRGGEDGAEAELYGARDPSRHGSAQSTGGELQRGGFALEPPRVAVGVEDAVSEEIVEGGVPLWAFGVVIESELEKVFEVSGFACDCNETLSESESWDSEEGSLVRAARGS